MNALLLVLCGKMLIDSGQKYSSFFSFSFLFCCCFPSICCAGKSFMQGQLTVTKWLVVQQQQEGSSQFSLIFSSETQMTIDVEADNANDHDDDCRLSFCCSSLLSWTHRMRGGIWHCISSVCPSTVRVGKLWTFALISLRIFSDILRSSFLPPLLLLLW